MLEKVSFRDCWEKNIMVSLAKGMQLTVSLISLNILIFMPFFLIQ